MLSHRAVNFFIFTPFLNFVLTFFVTVDSVPKKIRNVEQLLTTDILVPVTMKNAAKCDT